MPAHRRPTDPRRHVAAAVLLLGCGLAAVVVTAALSTDVPVPVAAASDTVVSTTTVAVTAQPTPTRPAAVVVAELETTPTRNDTLAQVLAAAGYPTDPDTAVFVDQSARSICADLGSGRTGLDILADMSARTEARGWSDEQSDGLVYIGVAADCAAYSPLLP